MIPIRYSLKEGDVQDYQHSINLEDGGYHEERFFFGLCPVSLKTSSKQDTFSTSISELKVMQKRHSSYIRKLLRIK